MARAIDIQPIIEEIKSSLDISSYSEHDKGFDDGLEYVLDLIEKAPTLTPPNEWVSVEERLPAPTENPVLVYDCTGVNMAWYSYAMGWTYRTRLPGVEITHWMPLPEPPKEETP